MVDIAKLKSLLGRDVLTGEADLLTYSYDSALERSRPDAVVVARSAEEARQTVAWCVKNRVPYVARGAGTNLSGGCIPLQGGIVLSLAKLDRILEIDPEGGFAVVEPGVVNLKLQEELAKVGRFYAPDPASYKVCTIGGNVGENAGGPRCLKYGVTTNHVLALEAAMPDGSLAKFSLSDAGPKLVSLLVGAEGTLGVATKVWVKALPNPETITTVLVAFQSLDSAMACVAEIIAAGIVPRVLEAMDKMTVDSIEAYVPAGYPKAEAVLLIELEGPAQAVAAQGEKLAALCRRHKCSEYRRAADAAEQERLWEGRRSAYAALSRLAPNVLVEDGVVPRSKLPEAARLAREIAARHRVQAALLFHAGDGNLHPNIIFDERDRELTARVKRAGYEILRCCVELGGSLSGEHGIGSDKRAAMAWLFSAETLALFRRIKAALDPDGLANPDKLFPLAGEKPPLEFAMPARRPTSAAAQALIESVRKKAKRKEGIVLLGAGSKTPAGLVRGLGEALKTTGLDKVLDLDQANYTVTVEAGINPSKLKEELASQGFHIPVPAADGTLGGLLATRPWAGLRDGVLGMRILLADGTVAELGGRVVKNVAGYDVPRLLLGSWGALAIILEVTLKLQSTPVALGEMTGQAQPFRFNEWHRKLKRAFDPEGLLNPWVQ